MRLCGLSRKTLGAKTKAHFARSEHVACQLAPRGVVEWGLY